MRLAAMLAGIALFAGGALAQTPSGPVPVTVDDFVPGPRPTCISPASSKQGALGKFVHHRELPGRKHRRASQPRYALLVRSLRSRRGAGHHHPAASGQAVHVDDDGGPGSLRPRRLLWRWQPHVQPEGHRHALPFRGGSHLRRSGQSAGSEAAPCLAGRDQGQAERVRANSRCQPEILRSSSR